MWKGVLVRRRKLGRSSVRGISEQSLTGIVHYRNDRPEKHGDIYIRWGTTSNVPGQHVLNTAEAIHEVADKRGFRLKLDQHNLCPRTWGSIDELPELNEDVPYPLIVRRATHHQGRFLHVANTIDELKTICNRYAEGDYYISEMINKVAEYRITFVQGRVAWVAQKTPGNPEDVAWNVAQGGRFDNVSWGDWPLRAVRVAREAFMLSSLDFGAVDIMVDEMGKCYVLEINSAPSQTSPYRQLCMAKCFDFIMINEDKSRIDVIEDRGDWKKFIHPALDSDRAILVGGE